MDLKSPSFELFHLMQSHLITRRKVQYLLLKDPNLEQLLKLKEKHLQHYFKLNSHHAIQLYKYIHDPHNRARNSLLYKEWKPITIYDDDFPQSLSQIPDPPLILYCIGDLSLLNSQMISVIGSRKPSQEASKKIEALLPSLIKHPLTIVSGLAYGIDAMAHQITLRQSGKTIAVLGYGYDHCYPSSHISLQEKIKNKGLILSEYPPNIRPQKWHFPERNRLISGLSKATLIIEATERSGTMITADQSLEQGKDIFVVPDSIFLKQSQGCIKLLKEGAIPITSGEEIINHLSI
ncbi:DNA-protecting protein DprA [Halalkalibacillus sediminis]|uniref:DNA-protecting protein DprA n=1 Tax=Halalkalibacillus sediminis TaxID=2018042 RepID=A0A2I0QWC8_9BACI|nr:DNA-processing protein DprA [Halalkalibacillus sediminis]PKR78609.1 DNA-protecting protein DprA [Halalkalibacillus sediminis]